MNTPLPYPSQSDPAMRRAAANPVDWRRHLPARWADRVVEALDFTRHVEYEMPAWRVQGHDADGAFAANAERSQPRVTRSLSAARQASDTLAPRRASNNRWIW